MCVCVRGGVRGGGGGGGGGADEGELREREHVRARVYVLCVLMKQIHVLVQPCSIVNDSVSKI